MTARAGVDPDREHRRVATANPEAIQDVARSFGTAGQGFTTTRGQGERAAVTIGTSFTNDGAAVYGVEQHAARLPADFRSASTRLEASSGELAKVAADLGATRSETAGRVRGLFDDLTRIRQEWAARVAAAGLLTPEQAARWIAERDRLAGQMTTRVSDVGRAVSGRIQAYEGVVRRALGLFADHGFAGAADLDAAAPPAPRPERGADQTGFGLPVTAGLAADPVNTSLGNFVEVETDLPSEGLLAGLTFARTYNSRSTRVGEFGPGWTSWASVRLVPRTWAVEYEGPDGQRVTFPRLGAGRYGRAVGIDALVEPAAGGQGWVLGWFDGSRWEFDAAGRPARVWSGPGTAVAFHHDDGGRLTELVHERGRRVRLEWDRVGSDGDAARVVAATADDGRRVDYGYDAWHRLVTARTSTAQASAGDELIAERRYGSDDAGRVESVTDADGVVEVVNTYDADGRVVTQRTPFGRLVTFAYEADGSTVVADDSAGPSNVYRHDTHGRLVALTDGHGHTQRTRYDRWGNPVEIVQRGGAVIRQEFDDRAHLVRQVLPNDTVQALTWDAADRLTAITVYGPDTPPATTRFAYDGAERVPGEVVDPEGGVTRLVVSDGLVREVVDPDGVRVRFAHDTDGNVVEAVDALGGTTRVERAPDIGPRQVGWRSTAVITPAGRRTELVHDAAGRLVARRDPGGGRWELGYTPAGRPAFVVDPTGARTETRYGPHGEPTTLVDGLGQVTRRQLDPFGNLAGLVDPDGAKWELRFDALSRLTAWTDPGGGTWWREHDADGRPTAVVDPTGVRDTLAYDPAGQLVRTDDGLVTTGYGYDGLGRPTTEVRVDGSTRHVGHDRCGRVVTVTDAAGGVHRHTYTPGGRPDRTVSPAGREERFVHDEAGRLVARIDGNGRAWRIRHDPDGLPVTWTSPTGLVETVEYDPDGRVVRHRRPGAGTSTYTYDVRGDLVSVTDRHGRREYTYDAVGRMATATDALGHTTRYRHDRRGHLVEVVDPLGHSTRYTHDAAGRLTAMTDPLGQVTGYRYDPAGRLRERLDPTGERHRFRYDSSGRIVERSAGGIRWNVERDVLGRPARLVRSDTGAVELTWDANDRLVAQQDATVRVGWAYDADGHRTRLTHPDGTALDYRHDAAGHLVAVAHPLLGEIRLRRDDDGRLLEVADGVASARFGYTDGGLTSHVGGPRGREVTTWLARDQYGRVVASADSHGRHETYRYDAAGQLTSAGERSFAYDAAGRLCAESGPGRERTYRYDAASRLSADGTSEYGHDEVGRRVGEVTAGRRRDLTYDPITEQPASVRTAHRLRYNALGQLAAVDDTVLAWDTAHPLQPPITIGADAVVGAHAPWAMVGPVGIHHLHPDRQGTPTAGAVRDAWGAGAPGTPGASLGFRGELVVDDLVWLRHRAYHPATRAFLQTDPWPPVPGTAVAANPYHYAGNDPVNQLDPFGLRPVTDDVFTHGLRGAGDWLGDNWEYLAGGALVVGGVLLTATGVGGVPGLALMAAGGALIGGGGSMVLQKATTRRVDYGRVGTDAAIGAVPFGAVGRAAGTAVRAVPGVTRALRSPTGTVFDRIVATLAPRDVGSALPTSFTLATRSGQDVWVHGNATRHIWEETRHLSFSRTISEQARLSALANAVDDASPGAYGTLQNVRNWELRFEGPRVDGLNPVLIHARHPGG